MTAFHRLRIARLEKRIGGQASTVVFEIPAALESAYRWKAGQHITVRFDLNGSSVRRTYSISGSPHAETRLKITVKRAKGGLVSNYINDSLTVGQEVEMMPPFGSFILEPQPNRQRTYYFFASGSGITPLFSMLMSVLLEEPYSRCHLLFGNRDSSSILFDKELAHMSEEYAGRLTVRHVLSGNGSWGSRRPWRRGRLDASCVEGFLGECPPYAQDTQHYICGPGSMNRVVRAALQELDVPVERIHTESYGNDLVQDDSVVGTAAKVQVDLAKISHTFTVSEGETVLAAGLRAGLELPFSCESGVCGACKAKLKTGKVHMRAWMALDEEEREAGQILTCQSLPLASELRLTYESQV